jgi:hypothetical protein
VRITGQEDANWLYVQLSRAKEDTRLHTIVAPEPRAGEVDLPDREPPDAYDQLAAALTRQGGQELAIDTRSRLDVRATPTKELRAERDRLRAALDQAPPDRRRVLERAALRRQQAEQDLDAVETKHAAEGGWKLFGRRGEGEQDQAARMLGARQAERAAQAEVAARAAQQEREGWLEANHHLGGDYREVSRELALRSRQRVAFAELEQPAYLRDALGPVPESVRGRRAWRQTARAVEDYRQRFQVTDLERPFGAEPARDVDPDRYQAWRQASGAVARLRARQQHRELDQTRSPGSVRSIADHSGGESTRRHDRTRQPDPVQGAERAVG